MPYVSLHHHTEYSLYDGADSSLRAARYADDLGQKALAITDHGTVSGVIKHFQACLRVGIKPILGCEVYYQPAFYKIPEKAAINLLPDEDQQQADYFAKRYHLTLLVKNNTGYKNLMQMLSTANTENLYSRYAIVDDALLEKYHEGLIGLSGCISGFVPQHILSGDTQVAFDKLQFFKVLFGDDLYLEVMPHNIKGQIAVNQQLELWSDLYGFPIVMTEDSHYVKPGDFDSYKIFRQIKQKTVPDNIDMYEVLYLHSEQEMMQAYQRLMGVDDSLRIQSYLNQSQRIADQCNVTFDMTMHLPTIPGVEDPDKALIQLAKQGAIAKQKVFTNDVGRKEILPTYKARLAYELDVLRSKGFSSIMLMAAYLVRFASENNIYCKGRGSVAGSLLAYFLDIHSIDPLVYRTSFERFYGPDRTEPPDIDLDVEDRYKDALVWHLKSTYGQAEQICTFGTLGVKSLLNKLTEILPFENGDAQRLRDAVNLYVGGLEDPIVSYNSMVREPELAYLEKKYRIITYFCYALKRVYYVGTHAAGVCVAAGNLTDKVAIQFTHDQLLTSFDMDDLNFLQLPKFDLLGSATLAHVHDAEQYAHLFYSPVPKGDNALLYDEDDLNSPLVMDAFKRGDTGGIMQSEKYTPIKMYKQLLKVTPHATVSDLAIVNACNRPATLREGTFDAVVEERKGRPPATVYGKAIVFQEDVMDICHNLAGMEWDAVNQVIKSLKHYTTENLALRDDFIRGMLAMQYTLEEAANLWQSMRRYLFNKGHAVAYSHLAARQMYLKQVNPLAFYLALLQNEGDKDKRKVYTADARRHGISFLIPHVNGGASYQLVMTSRYTYIQEGLMVLSGVGLNKALVIEQERKVNGEYKDLDDLKSRVPKMVLNKTVLDTFDRLGTTIFDLREYMLRCAKYNADLDDDPKVGF